MAGKPRFYLDENVPVAVAAQLRRRGIEAVSARDVGRLGESDVDHLRWASAHGYVLCTHDPDFIAVATASVQHAGMVFGQQHKHGIGAWVRFLELLCAVCEPEDMHNHIEYV